MLKIEVKNGDQNKSVSNNGFNSGKHILRNNPVYLVTVCCYCSENQTKYLTVH